MISNLSTQRIIIIYLAWWLVWIVISAWVLQWFGLPMQAAVQDSLVNNGLLALIGFAIYNTLRYYQPAKERYVYLRFAVLVVAVICTAVPYHILQYIFADDNSYLGMLRQSLPLRFCYAFLMISFISLLNWVWYYFRNERENENLKASAEKLAKDAELSGLRQQLQPHFLFNSLNSISALVGSKPEEARRMIQQLSDFLRGTIKKDEQSLVKLSDELSHLRLYLDIEKVRFGHRLNTIVESDERSGEMLLPSLLLQPLVENAIKFGLYDTTGEVSIRITAHAEAGNLLISIENPFDPVTARPKQGTGFGLSSVQRRLYLLYARNDLLQTESKGELFITRIKIPQNQ